MVKDLSNIPMVWFASVQMVIILLLQCLRCRWLGNGNGI